MATLAELEAAFDGPIPRAALDFALSCRADEDVALLHARIRAAGSRLLVRGQLRALRRRRADGSAYPEMLDDLRAYWQSYRAAMTAVERSRAVVTFAALPPAIAAE